jgi:hypothetical protein
MYLLKSNILIPFRSISTTLELFYGKDKITFLKSAFDNKNILPRDIKINKDKTFQKLCKTYLQVKASNS